MKNKILFVVVVFLTIILIVEPKNLEVKKKIKKEVKVEETYNEQLEEFVIQVVAAEMPASFFDEALKAQAVAARTFSEYKIKHEGITYEDLYNSTDQAHIDEDEMKNKWGSDFEKYYEKIKKAVNETKGEILTYNDEVIKSYYFAMSNGYTEDSLSVFNESVPYLQSVVSTADNESLNKFEVETIFNKDEFCEELEIECSNLIVNNQILDKTGRIKEITINNKMFTGIDVRKKLNLRSTDFKIEESNNEIKITTRGYGHGVGLSQYGANGMAEEGYNYKDILKHYYKDVEIKKM